MITLSQLKASKDIILAVVGGGLLITVIVLWNLNSSKSKTINVLENTVSEKQLMIDTLQKTITEKSTELVDLNNKYNDIEQYYNEQMSDLMGQLTAYETDISKVTAKVNETINNNLLLLSKATGWKEPQNEK